MKKIISFLSLLLFFTVALKAQTTVSIANTNVSANSVVQLPVTSGAALSVYSLTMHISYDPSVLEYQAINSNPFTGNFILNVDSANGLISIAWFSTTKVDITNKLFDLQFLYKGGTSAVSFTGTNEITDENSTAYNITFVNGSVSALPLAVSLSSVMGAIGDTVSVDLKGNSLKDIGSMTFKISYSSTAAEFIGVTNDVVGFTVGTPTGQINLAMFSTAGATFSDGTVLAKLKFIVKGGSTDLVFDQTSNITDVPGVTLTTNFTNGKVSKTSATFSLATVATAINGTNVNVPLNAISITNLASFTIHIAYDATVVDFVSVDNVISGTASANASNGVVNIAWFSTTAVNITNGKFADVVFKYHGGAQSTDLTLTADQFTDLNGANISINLISGKIDVVTDVENINSKIPDNYELAQNYPNPFNPSTTINFALKVTSQVSINIYNNLGQKVASLVNGSFSAGFKTIQFNASKLASGIYFYRIIATGVDGSKFIQAKKMILMK
ncbi:MAG TPA: T9SS type A sorting domain-containing protein [Ignavibacteria bacterium]|nr:T9SS type A sorting domain-containing protein [Ignavibacteria bacterium]